MNSPSHKPRYDRLLEFLPTFERPGSSCGGQPSPYRQRSWSQDYEALDRFIQVLYEDGWVLMFNWAAWQARAERLYSNSQLLCRARVSTLQRLLTFHLRKDHFTDGHLFAMLREGHVGAILRRIAELHASRADNEPMLRGVNFPGLCAEERTLSELGMNAGRLYLNNR